ncbi:hypothetical protein [uncultured Muribaculum sp.]|uniref:hypothetical protein n=1 Tax=uncultured Muribaculum sp. TaxID=1918613 RepID=UPI0025F6D8AC|nr:hypothetical protein [uncultured Muribaculum sp.]
MKTPRYKFDEAWLAALQCVLPEDSRRYERLVRDYIETGKEVDNEFNDSDFRSTWIVIKAMIDTRKTRNRRAAERRRQRRLQSAATTSPATRATASPDTDTPSSVKTPSVPAIPFPDKTPSKPTISSPKGTEYKDRKSKIPQPSTPAPPQPDAGKRTDNNPKAAQTPTKTTGKPKLRLPSDRSRTRGRKSPAFPYSRSRDNASGHTSPFRG